MYSVGFNLVNLGLFKYFYFFMELIGTVSGIEILSQKTSLNQYFSSLLHIKSFEIILPLTISYYSFQLISLAVDLKKGKIEERPGLYEYFSYILFFPIMIAGPILRYTEIRKQLDEPVFIKENMFNGIWLVLSGILKKIILSGTVASIIYPVFAKPNEYSGIALLLTSYAFAVHLYLDFSGLTDMARGMAKLLGFNLPENFKAPFFMTGFGDFWRRWHLTFSFWIRDYIYIPLGGSRCSEWRNVYNLVVTFTLGGLWHGANVNYVFWGLLTGILISIERFFNDKGFRLFPSIPYVKPIVSYLFFLNAYMVTWVMFFTRDLKTAFAVLRNIFTFSQGRNLLNVETILYIMLFTFFFHAIQEWPAWFQKFRKKEIFVLPILSLIIILILISNQSGNMDFFYSKF